jgi:hypothetical protein
LADLDEYERDYLERLKKQEKENPKPKRKIELDPLIPLDYVVLGLIRNGVAKYQTLFNRLSRVSRRKINSSYEKLKNSKYLMNHPDDTWKDRNYNPRLVMTDKGKDEIEKKIDELQEEYDKLVLLYEKKDKQKLREGMESNRSFFPLMMMMGITNGMMMGSMLGMNHMMMADFMADVDYAGDLGYGDGAGFGGEGGDFGDAGGDGGGFMDGGMSVGM